MPLVVECRCRQRFSVPDKLRGAVARCPACGSPITISAGPPAPKTKLADKPHGTATQQFLRSPFWFFLHGVRLADYQPGQTPPATRTAQNRILAGLALVVLGLGLLTFIVALIRFGLVLGFAIPLMGLAIAFVPFLFGFYFFATGLWGSQLLMMSRRGRGVRYLFGDHGARWFFIAVGCAALLIGFLIQLTFLGGAIFGRDPDRDRNTPTQVVDDPRHRRTVPALQGAEADRVREEIIEEFRKANAEVLQDPEVAAEFEKSLHERFPDR